MEAATVTPTRQRKEKKPNRTEVSGMAALAQAYSHPTRVRILTALNSPKRRASPIRCADEWGEDVTRLNYHFRELERFGFLECVEEHKRRGSIEHVYEPKATALAWHREWTQMPPIFKQNMLALTGRLSVEAMGAAIDAGTFESRDDTVLAQDTMRVDERGASEALALMSKTMELLMRLQEEAGKRLDASGEDGLLISYMLVGYEGQARPA